MRLPRLQQGSKPISSLTLQAGLRDSGSITADTPLRGRTKKRSLSMTKNNQASTVVGQSNQRIVSNHESPNPIQISRRFADTILSAGMKKVIPFEEMSEIQAATLDVSLCCFHIPFYRSTRIEAGSLFLRLYWMVRMSWLKPKLVRLWNKRLILGSITRIFAALISRCELEQVPERL